MAAGRTAPPWRVEFSRTAIDALRALERDEQRRVARRIGDLERAGPPGRWDGDGRVAIPASDQVLLCTVDAERRRIVVITLVPSEADASKVVGQLALRQVKRWMGGGVVDAIRNVRLAARSLRRSPGFSVSAVLTLALGIGASTAVFSVADGVLLEPLPYAEPDEVVTVWSQWTGAPKTWLSEEEYGNYRRQSSTLEDLALYFTSSHTFSSVENPELVGSAVVSPNTFSVLGVEPRLGRVFTWDEALGESAVVVLGHDIWQRRFGGDPGLVGATVEVNQIPFTVLGVLPEGFALPVDYGQPAPSAVFFPLGVDPEALGEVPPNGGNHGYYAVGRLAEGATVDEARAELEGIAGRLEAAGVYRESWNFRPLVFGVADDVSGSARGTIVLLLAACGFLLLIACGNVANLMLSRSDGRVRDVAVRRAMGASSGTIVRGLFLESALLAGVGGGLGVLLADLGIATLLSIDPDAVPRAASIGLDGSVMLFAIGISALTAVLFGWIPALRAARGGLAESLQRGGRGAGAQARGNRTRGLLVASQMAMAVVLLAGAGLTMRTFTELLGVDPGFDADEVLTARLTIPSATYGDYEALTGFWQELLRRLDETPGVARAAAARLLPLDSEIGTSGFRPVGYVPSEGEDMQAEWQFVTPGYFEVMGIAVEEGRGFEAGDRIDATPVMLLNRAAAERFWPQGGAIGARVASLGGDTATVVGIVPDVRHNGIRETAQPRYYRSAYQLGGPGFIRRMTVTLKADGRAEDLVAPLRSVVRSLDPTLPLSRVQTVDEVMAGAVSEPRFAMVLLGAFALMAVALAVLGIYGVLAYTVSRRTQEIGVRMALGADRDEVVGMVVRQGMAMAVTGVGIGMAATFGLTRFMEEMLWNVSALDPLTLVVVPSVFVLVALAASWVPAARAARVQPVEALRYE